MKTPKPCRWEPCKKIIVPREKGRGRQKEYCCSKHKRLGDALSLILKNK